MVRKLILGQLARYGFDGYALDYLEGPEPVLNMLCHESALHRTVCVIKYTPVLSPHSNCPIIQPISSRDFTPQQNKSMEDTNIASWIAGRTSYRIIRRREYNASSTRLANLKNAHVFKVQQVDHTLKAEMQRKVHELEYELTETQKEVDVKMGEHHQLKQLHQAAQVERRAIEAEKSQKQQEVGKWSRLKANLEPSEEELKLKQTGGDSYKANLQALNDKQAALAVKKAQKALEFGVSLALYFAVIGADG